MKEKCPFCTTPCNMEHCPYTEPECEDCSKLHSDELSRYISVVIPGLIKEREYLLETIKNITDTNQRLDKLRNKSD